MAGGNMLKALNSADTNNDGLDANGLKNALASLRPGEIAKGLNKKMEEIQEIDGLEEAVRDIIINMDQHDDLTNEQKSALYGLYNIFNDGEEYNYSKKSIKKGELFGEEETTKLNTEGNEEVETEDGEVLRNDMPIEVEGVSTDRNVAGQKAMARLLQKVSELLEKESIRLGEDYRIEEIKTTIDGNDYKCIIKAIVIAQPEEADKTENKVGEEIAEVEKNSEDAQSSEADATEQFEKKEDADDVKIEETFISYTVKGGDTLSKIANNYPDVSWKDIYDANKAIIGNNPNLIFPGQKLVIPGEGKEPTVKEDIFVTHSEDLPEVTPEDSVIEQKEAAPKSSDKSVEIADDNLDKVREEVNKTIKLLGTLVPGASLENLTDSLQNLPNVDPKQYQIIGLISNPNITWAEANILTALEKNKTLYNKLNALKIDNGKMIRNIDKILSSQKNKQIFEEKVSRLISPNYKFKAPDYNGWNNDLQYGYIKLPSKSTRKRIKTDFFVNKRYHNKQIVADIDKNILENNLKHPITNQKEVYA